MVSLLLFQLLTRDELERHSMHSARRASRAIGNLVCPGLNARMALY